MDEVIRATGAEHGIRRRERHQPLLGHAAGGSNEQLLGHAHLVEALGIGLCEQVQVRVLGEVGRQSHNLRVISGIVHEGLTKRRCPDLLALRCDRSDHRGSGESGLLRSGSSVHAKAPLGCSFAYD